LHCVASTDPSRSPGLGPGCRVARNWRMVLVEELEDEGVVTAPVMAKTTRETVPAPDREPAVKQGFLDKALDKPLYGPEGSPEGHVTEETKKAHQEHKMNKDLNANMNRGAKDNDGIERPPWYTKEWPKDCQYNSPGCALTDMETSTHSCNLKRDMVRGSERWREAIAAGTTSIRLSFMQLCDEDLVDIVLDRLKGNNDVTELDLSHNHIKDHGIQALVAALANGAAPNLRELRVYNNEFGKLAETMLTQGLPVFRKKLEVHWKEPSWARFTKSEEGRSV